MEFFHALTDGNGGLIFLKSLLAEYLQQKYGLSVPAQRGVLGRLEAPSRGELEDSFLKYSGRVPASRKETTAWHMKGTPEPDGFLHHTSFTLDVQQVLQKAHSYYNIKRSMSRGGTPTDNPIIEAINGWIKEELYLDFGLNDAEDVPALLDRYVFYYNNRRPAAALGYKSPVQYKTELGFL